MKKCFFIYIAFLSLSLMVISGCVSAGIVNPNEPPIDPIAIITWDDELSIKYNGTYLENGPGFRFSNIIYSGNNRIQVTQSKEYTVSSKTTSTYTQREYVPYKEIWGITYEFKPGMAYKIHVENARVGYDGKNLWTNDSGVTITGDDRGNNVRVEHADGVNIRITEHRGGFAGSAYFGPYFGGNIRINFWQEGPGVIPSFGPRFGLLMLRKKFGMILAGEGGGEIGVVYSRFEKLATSLGYYYGGMTEFYFPKLALGIGGGMTTNYTQLDPTEDILFYTYPYAEFAIIFGSRGENLLYNLSSQYLNTPSIFARYYFNDTNDWQKKFAAGFKWRW